MKRYIKNMNMLSEKENESLKDFKVCVVGCGGLGGYVIEMLGRLGIGHITAVDGDIFDETNLNRQLLSNSKNIGQKKSQVAKERMMNVNPLVNINSITSRINIDNAMHIMKDHDVIVDAVDNIESKFIIKSIALKTKTPLIYGAIGGWYGQVSTILPNDNTLEKIYPNKDAQGIEKHLGNPSFTPALVASIQVSEVLKILLNRGELLSNKVLHIDLLEHEYTLINFNE